MKKEDFLIIGTGLIILTAIIIASFLLPSKTPEQEKSEDIEIITDYGIYKIGGSLKVKIENNLDKDVCFSSCYPYYFEKKNEDWENYNYQNCPDSDSAQYCVSAKQVKAFELIIPAVEEGVHRLAISACLACNYSELFKEEQKFYSNTFIIK